MRLNSMCRRLNFTAHLTFLIGGVGAVAAFFVLAIAGLVSTVNETVQGAYIDMEIITRFVIIPACFASLLTGFIHAIGTPWGLFRYYWIAVKFSFTIIATIVLLVHVQPIGYLGLVSLDNALSGNELRSLRIQLIANSGAALLVLLMNIILSVYKPWGKIYPLQKRQNEVPQLKDGVGTTKKSWLLYLLLILIVLVVIMFVILHLSGNNMHHQ